MKSKSKKRTLTGVRGHVKARHNNNPKVESTLLSTIFELLARGKKGKNGALLTQYLISIMIVFALGGNIEIGINEQIATAVEQSA